MHQANHKKEIINHHKNFQPCDLQDGMLGQCVPVSLMTYGRLTSSGKQPSSTLSWEGWMWTCCSIGDQAAVEGML